MTDYPEPAPGAPAWLPKLERRAPFIAGYLEALFFTDSSPMEATEPEWESDGSIPACRGCGDIAPATWARIFRDCKRFQREARLSLAAAYASGEYDESQAGRDFHFTRNGHGVGFWDRRELCPRLGERLSRYARRAREVDSYVGDDGKIYLA